MLRPIIFVVLAAALAACASTPTYSAAGSPTSAGYSETQIESNRYFVTYRAPGAADAALLQDYALLRAADITLQNNHDWFWVDRRSVDEDSTRSSGPSIGVGLGGGSFGRHTGVGGSVGFNFPLGGAQGAQARSATVEIRLGEGPKPDAPNAYDARSTSANIRSRVVTAR
jgi:hypothetical protein